MPRLHFQMNEFTPAEAERITGVSVTQQRNWRRYGYLPKSLGKHARFKPHQLAAMTIMQTLSERGIGPAASHGIALFIGAHVIYYACLRTPDAFEDRTGLDFKWYDARALSILIICKHVAFSNVAEDIDPEQFEDADPSLFVIWFADDLLEFFDDLTQAFSGRSRHEVRLSGACIVMDLECIAAAFLDRTERPLFIAELVPDDDASEAIDFIDISSLVDDGGGDG